jgi:hypothetical protein
MDKRFVYAGNLTVDKNEIASIQHGFEDDYGYVYALMILKSGEKIKISERNGELALFKQAFKLAFD